MYLYLFFGKKLMFIRWLSVPINNKIFEYIVSLTKYAEIDKKIQTKYSLISKIFMEI